MPSTYETEMPTAIPDFVRHEDLLAAAEPLLTLLGVNAMQLMSDPPLTVALDKVTFTCIAEEGTPGARPSSDDEFAMWVRDVVVPTDQFAGESADV